MAWSVPVGPCPCSELFCNPATSFLCLGSEVEGRGEEGELGGRNQAG